MIGIIDYGCGNVGSILNMFSKIGVWSELVSQPEKVDTYSALVLPGVGTFDKGVAKLKSSGFWDVINSAVLDKKTPLLGICLGMQLFFEGSEEGKENGFGWLKGKVQKFDSSLNLRVPHMGWSSVEFKKENYQTESEEYYFVHSFHAPVETDHQYVLATTQYGIEYPSAIQKENILGLQFHPEKSLKAGMSLLEKWAKSIPQV